MSDELVLELVDRLQAATAGQAKAQRRVEDVAKGRDNRIRALQDDLSVSRANANAWKSNFEAAKAEVETLQGLNSEQAEELKELRLQMRGTGGGYAQAVADREAAVEKYRELQDELEELRKEFDGLLVMRNKALGELEAAEGDRDRLCGLLEEVKAERDDFQKEAEGAIDATTGRTWQALYREANAKLQKAENEAAEWHLAANRHSSDSVAYRKERDALQAFLKGHADLLHTAEAAHRESGRKAAGGTVEQEAYYNMADLLQSLLEDVQEHLPEGEA